MKSRVKPVSDIKQATLHLSFAYADSNQCMTDEERKKLADLLSELHEFYVEISKQAC